MCTLKVCYNNLFRTGNKIFYLFVLLLLLFSSLLFAEIKANWMRNEKYSQSKNCYMYTSQCKVKNLCLSNGNCVVHTHRWRNNTLLNSFTQKIECRNSNNYYYFVIVISIMIFLFLPHNDFAIFVCWTTFGTQFCTYKNIA